MKQVRLFSTDLDGTVVGDNAATARFRDFWQSLPDETRPILVFNSGRLIDDQLELMEQVPLPKPNYIIGGVGTMLSCRDQPSLSTAFTASLGQDFEVEKIIRVMSGLDGVTIQTDRYQHGLKSSWYMHDADEAALAHVEERLAENGINARVVYSSSRDLDILPRAADKGAAINWLCDHLEFGLDEAVVAGDTGNDKAMFQLPDIRGIVVANALEELKALGAENINIFQASETEADGVLQGLKHWTVGNSSAN